MCYVCSVKDSKIAVEMTIFIYFFQKNTPDK